MSKIKRTITRCSAALVSFAFHLALALTCQSSPAHSQAADVSLLRLQASRAFVTNNPGWQVRPQTVSYTGALARKDLFNDMRWFLARNAEVSFAFENCQFPDGFDTAYLHTPWTDELKRLARRADNEAFQDSQGSAPASLTLRIRSRYGVVIFPIRGLKFSNCTFGSPGATGTSLQLGNIYAIGDVSFARARVHGMVSIWDTVVVGSLNLSDLTADTAHASNLLLSNELRLQSVQLREGLTLDSVEAATVSCSTCQFNARSELRGLTARYMSISRSEFGEEIALRGARLKGMSIFGERAERASAERWVIADSSIWQLSITGAAFTSAVKISFLDTRPKPSTPAPPPERTKISSIFINDCVFDGPFGITDSQLSPSLNLNRTIFGSSFSLARNRYHDDVDTRDGRFFKFSLRDVQFADPDIPWDQLPSPREWNGLHYSARDEQLREQDYLALLRQLEAKYEAAGNLTDRNQARLTRKLAERQVALRQRGTAALFAKLEQYTWGAWFGYGTSPGNAPWAYLLVLESIFFVLVFADSSMHRATNEESELRNLRRFGIRLFSPPHEYVRTSNDGLGDEINFDSWWQPLTTALLVSIALVTKIGPTHVVLVPTRFRLAALSVATLGWLLGYVLLIGFGITLYNTQPAVYALFHGFVAKG